MAAHKRHKKHEYALDNIPEGTPTEQIHHRLGGGSGMPQLLGNHDGDWYRNCTDFGNYPCQKCSKEGTETPIVKAPREKNIIPDSVATPEAIARIIPQGGPISNWLLKASQVYPEPVYEQLHRELLKWEVLHADETALQVLHEPGKEPQSKNYMWLYRTSGISSGWNSAITVHSGAKGSAVIFTMIQTTIENRLDPYR